MNRTLSLVFALVTLGACHPRSASREPPAAVERAPIHEALVRLISRPAGASVVVADIDGRRVAVVADDEERAIQVIDLDARRVLESTRLDGAPGQILLAPNGTLFVAQREGGRLVAFRFRGEPGALQEIARRDTGDEPFGVALTHDNASVLVTTIGAARLEAYRAEDLAPVFATPLPRDPRGIVFSDDGARAFVSHATGSVLSVVDVGAATAGKAARTIALDARERRRDFDMEFSTKPMAHRPEKKAWPSPPMHVRITMKRSATQGFALASFGGKVLLPETLVLTADSEGIPTGYGAIEQSTLSTHVPFVARVAAATETLENPDFSGASDRQCFEHKAECILPRAAVDDGRKLYVACLDSDEVLVVDPSEDVEHAPACHKTLKERKHLRVESPSSVAIDAERSKLIVFSSFSRKLTVAELDRWDDITEVSLPRSAALPELLVDGRNLFHRSADARIAKNGRACASCHVDGREDGLVWPTPEGKRQTPMLAGRLEGTAPYGWNGEHVSLAVHIKNTVKNLEGTGLGAREMEALAEYITTMRPPAKRASASESVRRGKAVFASNETGCSSCHVEDTRFTDHETHALKGKTTSAKTFDTPSLAFVGQTPPYFHDGRFRTLEDLIDGCDGMMGKTKHLSSEDRADLVAYLRSL